MDPYKELKKSVDKVSRIIEEKTSYKRLFIGGLISGVATALGATVIAGIVLFSLSKLAKQFSLQDYPEIHQLLIDAEIIEQKTSTN